MTTIGYPPVMRTGGTDEAVRARTPGRRWWWAPLLASSLALGACGSDMDDLDEGPEPPEADTEIVPGEAGPVD